MRVLLIIFALSPMIRAQELQPLDDSAVLARPSAFFAPPNGLSLISRPVFAGSVAYEKVLLPLSPGELAGAQGSLWRTTVVLSNLSDRQVDVEGHEGFACPLGNCPFPYPQAPIPGHGTISIVGTPQHPGIRGSFLLVEAGRLPDVALTIRTHDVSRQHETFGTALPVITHEDLAHTFGMGVVPLTSGFRSTLRLYDFDPRSPPAALVRMYRVTPTTYGGLPDELLLAVTPAFVVPTDDFELLWFPAFAEIPLSHDARLSGTIRVEVVGLDGARDYWGYVSVTHNDTQHVTIIAPK